MRQTYLNVRHPVVVQIRARREPLAAHLTLVRLFAAVNAHVRVQRRGRAKALPADAANVRLFAGVRPHVTLQQTRTIEGLAAHLTGQHGAFPAGRARLRGTSGGGRCRD